MTPDLLASIQEVEGALPMTAPAPVEGRVLLVDGDSLAYACAGNDDTAPGEARTYLQDRLASAMRASGATACMILLTDPASHKGYRFAVARAKPYQGSRDGKHKPKNYGFLRTLLQSKLVLVNGAVPGFDITAHAEADDLFGKHVTALGWRNCVLYVPDKDLRMVPGLHLHWTEHTLLEVPEGAWEVVGKDGKVYGEKWFWLQMLQGDAADNIPGLPAYVEDGRSKKIGPVTAEGKLARATCGWDALVIAQALYDSHYGEDGTVQMAEQGVLLWMRRDPGSDWFDVFREGRPLYPLLAAAILPLMERVEIVRAA